MAGVLSRTGDAFLTTGLGFELCRLQGDGAGQRYALAPASRGMEVSECRWTTLQRCCAAALSSQTAISAMGVAARPLGLPVA
jgi:hypothetical protein